MCKSWVEEVNAVTYAGLRDSYVLVLSSYTTAVHNRISQREYVLSDHQGPVCVTLMNQEIKWEGRGWCCLPHVPEFLSEPCILTGKGTSTEVRKRSLKIWSLEHWLLEWDCIYWMYPRRMLAACRKEKSLTFCPQLEWEAFRGVDTVAGSHYPHNFMLCTWKELWLARMDLPQISLCVCLSAGELSARGEDRVLLHTMVAVMQLLSCTLCSNSEGSRTKSEFHCKDTKCNEVGHHPPAWWCQTVCSHWPWVGLRTFIWQTLH